MGSHGRVIQGPLASLFELTTGHTNEVGLAACLFFYIKKTYIDILDYYRNYIKFLVSLIFKKLYSTQIF